MSYPHRPYILLYQFKESIVIMDNRKALESLIHITNCNFGYVPSTPTEFNQLALAIKQKTDSKISLATIKRLWGYVRYDQNPTLTTLNVLCKYNDFKDWETFIADISLDSANVNASSGFLDHKVINANSLNLGDRLHLKWQDSKECELEYIAYLKFKVLYARNIKLEQNDICTLHSVSVGLPLFISNIQRGSMIIPAYIGAKKGGVQSIEILDRPDVLVNNETQELLED